MAASRTSLLIRNRETLIPLTEMCKKLDGGPYCYYTLIKWCSKGKLRDVRDEKSGRVKLERVKAGRGWASSMEAYLRFLTALNGERE